MTADRPGDRQDDASGEAPAPLTGAALVKEVCRLIREARKRWDAHENASARRMRSLALRLYLTLNEEQKEQVPQVLRVWLRYRSEKYYGSRRGGRGKKRRPPQG